MDGHDMSDDSMSMSMDSNSSSMSMDSDSFCSGSGVVMLSGFQTATESSVACVLFLFEGAAVDNETKYAFAIIGVFLMAFTTEMIRYGRELLSKGAPVKSFGIDILRVGAFAVQMLLAYFIMLLVMLYEYVFLIAIILGLSTGHLVTLRLVASRKAVREAAGEKDVPEVVAMSSSTPCCNNATSIA